MSEFWNKDDDNLDSVPVSHTETESVDNNVNTEMDIKVNTEVDTDVDNDTTYHWVNPKLQEYDSQQSNDTKTADYRTGTYESYQFSSPEEKQPKKKKPNKLAKKFGLCASLAIVFGVVASLAFQGVNAIGNQLSGSNNESEVVIPTTETVDDTIETSSEPEAQTTSTAAGTVSEVAANAMPSVVSISNVGVQEITNFFGSSESYESTSSGSGIIVGQNDEELLIATNNHVVTGASTITVSFIDDTSVEAQIKGTDANNDLAVVAVKISDLSEDTLSQIKVATIGNSDELVVGEQVVAIGNALGYGQSVTSGYISALDREVTVDNVTANLIQTDAAINPGNSGGALLNMKGELIGINAVKFASSEVEGMGYAIPISTAEPILGDLMTRVTRSKVDTADASYLGVSCKNVTSETAEMYEMPTGVFIAGITEGSAAEKAGMQKGDIITSFDGTSVTTYDELVNALAYYAAGETVDIVVQRTEAGEYQEYTLSITLDSKPSDTDQSQTEQQQQGQQGQQGQDNSGMPNVME